MGKQLSPINSAPAPSPSPALDPEDVSHAYYTLLLSTPELSNSIISAMANKMLAVRIAKSYEKEMNSLSGELRDEWKGRVAGVKGDYMARIVPQTEEVEPEDGEEEDATKPPMLPTIISDSDDSAIMSSKVDALVESEFSAHLKEAEKRVRSAVEKHEALEMEVWLGGILLEARAEEDDDEEVSRIVQENLEFALEAMGIDYDAIKKEATKEKPEVKEVEKELSELKLST